MAGKRIRVTSDASVLELTCSNVTWLDSAFTVGLVAGLLGTIFLIVSCLHVFVKVAFLGSSQALVLHLGWFFAGTCMITVSLRALQELAPMMSDILKAAMICRGDELRIDAAGWKITCYERHTGHLHLSGHWWPARRTQFNGATSSMKGALVLPALVEDEASLVVVSHTTPFHLCKGMPLDELKAAVNDINSFLLQLGLSSTPPTPPVCASEAIDAHLSIRVSNPFNTFSQGPTALSDLQSAISGINDVVARAGDDGSSLETQLVPYLVRSNLCVSQLSTANPEQLLTGLPAVDMLLISRPPLWYLVYAVGLVSVHLGKWACWGMSSYSANESGIIHLLMAAASLFGAFMAIVLSTEKVLRVEDGEWFLWRAVAWLRVEYTANPKRGDTVDVIGAMVSANVSVYDASHSSYHTSGSREQARLFTAPLNPDKDPNQPLGDMSRFIPPHPAFRATPTVIMRRRLHDSVESVVCFNAENEIVDGKDAFYAAFRINAHLSSLRNTELHS